MMKKSLNCVKIGLLNFTTVEDIKSFLGFFFFFFVEKDKNDGNGR